MSETAGPGPSPPPPGPGRLMPYGDRIRSVGPDDPWQWLAAGWRDLRRARRVSLTLGLAFVAAGYAVTGLAYQAGAGYLIAPLLAGFFLVSPALAVGFYAVSRELDRGGTPTLATALLAWRANPARLLGTGLAFVFYMIVWLRLAALIYAIAFPHTSPTLQGLLNITLFRQQGLVFLSVGTLVGGVMALFAFMVGAVSPQLILDQKGDFVPSIVISTFAVAANFRVMLLWGGIILVVTAAGLAAALIGLAVTLPLIGHASWHAYKALVTRPAHHA